MLNVFKAYFAFVQVDDKETLLREKKQRQEEILRKEREKVDFLFSYHVFFTLFLLYILYSVAVVNNQYLWSVRSMA